MSARRIVVALVSVLAAPIVLATLIVTIATATGHARPIGRMWRNGLDT